MPAAKCFSRLCSLALLSIVIATPVNVSSAAPSSAQARLLKAINNRDVEGAKAALDAGADPNLAGEFLRTPLHEAASESSAILALLLARGAQPNVIDSDGRTPLHRASSDSARLLLDYKADFLILDKSGNTALHTAAEENGATCQLLVEAGLPVDARNNAGLTPLHFASLQAQQGAAEYLLSRGADINAKTLGPYSYKWSYIAWDVKGMEEAVPTGSTPLSIAIAGHERTKWSSGRYSGFVTYLRTKGAAEAKKAPWFAFILMSPIGFAAFFWLIFQADAYLRDWTPLAQRFSASGTPAQVESHQDGSVGRVGTIQLRKMLRVAVTGDGLYVAMPAWVLAAHPPLHIPWSALRIEACSSGITGTRVQLRVSDPSVPIFLAGGVADHVVNRIDPSLNCKGAS
jgi:hypothetical protein